MEKEALEQATKDGMFDVQEATGDMAMPPTFEMAEDPLEKFK